MDIKSDKELLIEFRNKVSGRIIENKANTEYWGVVVRKAKSNSQEIIDARKSVELNEDNVKKDKVFLKCIDLMMKKGNY
jgi:hypothetical protein